MAVESHLNRATEAQIDELVDQLSRAGAVCLPRLVGARTLQNMQDAFASRLRYLNWNSTDGYQRTECKRRMVPDVLMLAQGFVDLALHPLVIAILDKYLGPAYELCEAKGWETLPTKRDFHGWHGDMWYDQTKVVDQIPREVKLAFYLSDVRSGAFQYLRRTHGQHAPHHLQRAELDALCLDEMSDFVGPAGTAILFDTSGVHRQGIPVLHPRRAIFYNYHDPAVPLQAEDVAYYRYHPLHLNAAFLGDLTERHTCILGFGNQTHLQPSFVRPPTNPRLHYLLATLQASTLMTSSFCSRVLARIGRLLRPR